MAGGNSCQSNKETLAAFREPSLQHHRALAGPAGWSLHSAPSREGQLQGTVSRRGAVCTADHRAHSPAQTARRATARQNGRTARCQLQPPRSAAVPNHTTAATGTQRLPAAALLRVTPRNTLQRHKIPRSSCIALIKPEHNVVTHLNQCSEKTGGGKHQTT